MLCFASFILSCTVFLCFIHLPHILGLRWIKCSISQSSLTLDSQRSAFSSRTVAAYCHYPLFCSAVICLIQPSVLVSLLLSCPIIHPPSLVPCYSWPPLWPIHPPYRCISYPLFLSFPPCFSFTSSTCNYAWFSPLKCPIILFPLGVAFIRLPLFFSSMDLLSCPASPTYLTLP